MVVGTTNNVWVEVEVEVVLLTDDGGTSGGIELLPLLLLLPPLVLLWLLFAVLVFWFSFLLGEGLFVLRLLLDLGFDFDFDDDDDRDDDDHFLDLMIDSISDSSLSNAAVFVPVTLVNEQDNGTLDDVDDGDSNINSSSSNRLSVSVCVRFLLLLLLFERHGKRNRCIICYDTLVFCSVVGLLRRLEGRHERPKQGMMSLFTDRYLIAFFFSLQEDDGNG